MKDLGIPWLPRRYVARFIGVMAAGAGFGSLFGRGFGAISATIFEHSGMFEPDGLTYLPALSAWIGAPVGAAAMVFGYHLVRKAAVERMQHPAATPASKL